MNALKGKQNLVLCLRADEGPLRDAWEDGKSWIWKRPQFLVGASDSQLSERTSEYIFGK